MTNGSRLSLALIPLLFSHLGIFSVSSEAAAKPSYEISNGDGTRRALGRRKRSAYNSPPSISGTPSDSINENSSYAFTPNAFDPDGDELTFSIANKPYWAYFNPQTGALSGSATTADPGRYPAIRISVTDGLASAELPEFTIDVIPDEELPSDSTNGTDSGGGTTADETDLGGACEFTIDSVADWQQINNPDINVFCVAPGDYSNAGVIQITADGSFSNRRFLRTIDSTHPVHQAPDMQAVVRYIRLHANHWTISGIVVRESIYESITLESAASFNTLDSLLIERSHSIGLAAWESSHNTIQNSVMRNPVGTPGKDSYHIYVDRFAESLTVKSNELYNATGAWQQGPGSRGNHSIIDNDMYMTPERYTDCNGNLDPSGNCSCGEMYVVLKGIDDNNSVVTIEGNRMWGMRQNDPLCMSTGSPGQGINLGSGNNDTRNVFIKNNYIFDNHRDGVYLGGVVSDVLIEGNLVHGNSNGLSSGYGQNIETINNSFVGNDSNINFYGTHWGRTEGNLDAAQLPAPVCFTIKKITDPQTVCLN